MRYLIATISSFLVFGITLYRIILSKNKPRVITSFQLIPLRILSRIDLKLEHLQNLPQLENLSPL